MSHLPSYLSGVSDTPLLGESIGENLSRTVERLPDHEALVVRHQDFRCTYRELWDRTTRLAKAMMAHGIQKGDRVAMWAPNRYEWVLVQYATARIGAIQVNVNPAYKANELAYALNKSGVRMLVMAERFRQTDYVKLFDQVKGSCPTVEKVFNVDRDWDLMEAPADTIDDQALRDRELDNQFDDPINIQYTSGTTGAPKGATLSHHNILNNGYFVGKLLNYTEEDRICVPVPFYHCFGMVMCNLAATALGCTIVVPSETFDPGTALDAVQAERCTSLYGVPSMFIAELNHPDFDAYDLSSLRTGIMAGSPCPIEVMKKVESRMNMRDVTICYGMTETSPVSTQSKVDAPLERRVSTVGTIHPHVEIKIIDPATGRVVSRGVQGELCTRGYSVMVGYWNDPEATAKAIDSVGWMHTGDLATIDDEGYVKITGRIKDMICRGGENIYPREIEEYLYQHPEIEDVQVIGVPSSKYVEEVMAWVKIRKGTCITEEDLVSFCRGQIATYKIPRYWKFVEDFPMTVTGKVQKFVMREQSTRELGLDELLTA
ncbi:MAG: AMP-binding protein [Myxococcota bacterium]